MALLAYAEDNPSVYEPTDLLLGYKNMVTKTIRAISLVTKTWLQKNTERLQNHREKVVTKELADKEPVLVNPPMPEGVLFSG